MLPFKNSFKIEKTRIDKGQKITKKKYCPGYFQITNAGAISCTKNCPSVHFLEESRML